MSLTQTEPVGVLDALANRATLIPTAFAVLAVLPVFMVSSQSVVLQHELGFGKAQLGLAISACYAMSALTARSFGRLIQAAGPSRGLRMSALFSLGALLVIGVVARSWWELLVAMGLCGAANASAQVASNLSLAGGVPLSRQALAFGAKQAAVPFSSLIAGFSAPVVAALVGWRGNALVAASVVAAVLLFAPRLAAGRDGDRARSPVRGDPFLIALGVSGLCAGAIGNALPAFTVDAATSIGFGHDAAALLLALGGAAAVVGRIGAGWLADKRHSPGLTELIGVCVIGTAAFVVLVIAGDSRMVFALALLVAFAGGWGWAGIIYFSTVRAHPLAAGTASGFVLSWVYTGNVLGPAGVGAIAAATSYRVAWVVSAVVLAGAAVAAVVARRTLTGGTRPSPRTPVPPATEPRGPRSR